MKKVQDLRPYLMAIMTDCVVELNLEGFAANRDTLSSLNKYLNIIKICSQLD